MLAEVAIALAVVGILLTAILQLQFNVSQRIVYNTQTCNNFLEVKKDLAHWLIREEGKKDEEKSSFKKITCAPLEKYNRLIVYKITRAWHVLRYEKDIEFIFMTVAPEKKDEK